MSGSQRLNTGPHAWWRVVTRVCSRRCGSVAKFDFWGKIQKSCVKNSMTYRLPNSRKSNFATEPDVQGANLLKQVSPVAWQHINFFGRYEFRKGPEAINMHEIVRELARLPVRLASAG